MNPNQIFNSPNIIYWLLLAVIILWQGYTIGNAWSEWRRWVVGCVTLFGTTGVMVFYAGWDGPTWAALALTSTFTRSVLERYVLGEFWKRRESARWTAEYFSAYLWVLIYIILGSFDLVTWGLMFTSLGVAGAVKTGWEAARDSYQAGKIRERTASEELLPRKKGKDAISGR